MSVGAKTLLMLYTFEKGPVGVKTTEKFFFFFKSCKKYFFGRNDAKAETPVLWPPHVKS